MGFLKMSAKILRQKYNREFAGMERYSARAGWMIVAGYVLQISLAVMAGGHLLSFDPSWVVILMAIAIIVFIGTRFRGLNNIIHECSHATFCKERADNWAVGKFCAMLLFSSFSDYRDEHLSHHAHLGDYDHDMDLSGIKDLKIHESLTFWVVIRHLITPFLGRHLPYYLHLNFATRDGQAYLIGRLALLAVLAILVAIFPLTISVFLIASFGFSYSALNYWADCLDHAGIVASGDDLVASRNILAPRVLRAIFFPRNDCFHLVHHLFPHIPARHLEASHLMLTEDVLYRSRPNAVSRSSIRQPFESTSVFPAE